MFDAPIIKQSPSFQEYLDENQNSSTICKHFIEDISEEARVDYRKQFSFLLEAPKITKFSLRISVEIPENFRRNSTRGANGLAARVASTGPAVIELVIVVDKEFGDVFQQNYQRVVDYLTIYFWDVNIRYKTLWSVDLSIRVNGLLIMDVNKLLCFR